MKWWILVLGMVFWFTGYISAQDTTKQKEGIAHQQLFAKKSKLKAQKLLRDEKVDADLVLSGIVSNPREGRDRKGKQTPSGVQGTIDFTIESTIKSHPILAGRTQLELPVYIRTDPTKENRYLVFLKVSQRELDPYRVLSASPALLRYLEEMPAQDADDTAQFLAYAFRHLEHSDSDVAEDAFLEFSRADYRVYRKLAAILRPDVLARSLTDPNVAPESKGIYALLLGHCGQEKHGVLFRTLLEDQTLKQVPLVDRAHFMTGYMLLQPKEGWQYTLGVLKDSSLDFNTRYTGLRAVRFLVESWPDVIPRKELVDGVAVLLDQEDIADLAIHDLRKWGQWDLVDRILTLSDRKSHDVPLIQRAIVLYALICAKPQAVEFIKQMRQKHPVIVQQCEALLKREQAGTAHPPN
jgi:hypothetical protein